MVVPPCPATFAWLPLLLPSAGSGTAIHCCCSFYPPACSSAALFPGGQQVPSNSKLKTTIVGAVCVARDGADFAISLNRALKLDDTHQASLAGPQCWRTLLLLHCLRCSWKRFVCFRYGAG